MDLSILIPARNEEFLGKTVENILENIRGNTEIIVVLDGYTHDIPKDVRVIVIHHSESIGQRAATNEAAKLSKAKYVMKCDAHCSFDEGFDVKMIAEMRDNWTLVPVMKNLHAFDWVCENGHRRYQGPSGPCNDCGKPTKKDILWRAKPSPNSVSYTFDNTLHFQYWKEFSKRSEGQGDITPTMSLQGSCWMATREKYWELELCDEKFGSWGQQGVEVACKTWLSGGEVMCNRKTWYAHMFRTQGKDFGFPYPLSGNKVEYARQYSRDLFIKNKWPKAIHNFEWLINKFSPVPGWNISKGIVYYTDNRLDEKILKLCQENLKKATNGHRIVSVSLKPLDFSDNIHLELKRGYLTMFKQILTGLEKLDTDIVFLCEHDVLYHPSHFDFIPPKKDVYYYNVNVWKLRQEDGHALKVDDCRQTSGLCANRELLINHYKKRIKLVEENGFTRNMGFEPGTHNRKERVDDYKSEKWESKHPNIDIRHNKNLTPSRWRKDQFRNQKYTIGWIELESIPGWGKVRI